MKKAWLVLLMLCTASSVFAEEETRDIVKDGIKYFVHRYDADGVTNYAYVKGREATTSTDLVIPAYFEYEGATYRVERVYKYAFKDDDVLTRIDLPATITEIDDAAFQNCTSLTEVVLRSTESLVIGSNVFANCTNLVTMELPECVSRLYNDAFLNCANWVSDVNLPNLTFFEHQNGNIFEGCASLRSVTFGNKITKLGYGIFKNCTGLTSFTVPDGVKTIEHNAFEGCTNLTEVNIPSSVTSIGAGAFENCTGLKQLQLPALNSLDYYAFAGSGLTSITLPESLTSLPDNLFKGCLSLKSCVLPSGITEIPFNTFYNCTALEDVTIGPAVESIDESCFYNCSSLTSLDLPASLKTIGPLAFGHSGLESVTLPSSVTTIAERAFEGSALKAITLPNSVTSLGERAFEECSNLKSCVLPDGLTVIPRNAFSKCSALESVTLGSFVEEIKEQAFFYCDALTSITFPATLKSIESSAFESSDYACNLTNITCMATTPPKVDERAFGYHIQKLGMLYVPITSVKAYKADATWGKATVQAGMFRSGTLNDLSWELLADGTLSITGTGSMPTFVDAPRPWDPFSSDITKLIVGEGVTNIGDYAFKEFPALATVDLPTTITDIGESAFHNCTSLTEVVLRSTESLIMSYDAFAGCTNLVTMELPECVSKIYTRAFTGCTKWVSDVNLPNAILDEVNNNAIFEGCASLRSVTLGNKIPQLTYGMFKGCTGLTSFTVPEGVETISHYAFSGCTNLTVVNIPNSVTTIGLEAFENCTSLKQLQLPALTSLGDRTFAGSGLTSITLPESLTSLPDRLFMGCSSLKSCVLPSGITEMPWEMFADCTALEDITFGSAVEAIGNECFLRCSSLTSLNLPASVKTIGSQAFFDSGLESITLPSSITYIGELAFYYTKLQEITCLATTPPATGDNVFGHYMDYKGTLYVPSYSVNKYSANSVWNKANILPLVQHVGNLTWDLSPAGVLSISGEGAIPDFTAADDAPWASLASMIRKVTVGNGVTSLGTHALAGLTEMTEVTLPATLTQIGDAAFAGSTGMEMIVIPEKVTNLGSQVFSGCTALQRIDCMASVPPTVAKPTDTSAFGSIVLNVPGGSIYDYKEAWPWSLCDLQISGMCEGFTYTLVSDSVLVVSGQGALPERDTRTASWWYTAFADKAKVLVLEEGITDIGRNAFYRMPELEEVVLPSSLTEITQSYAFRECKKLKTIEFPEGINLSGSSIFRECTALEELDLTNVATLGTYVFYKCTGLKNLTIGESTTNIGASAFSGCTGLQSITSQAVTPPKIAKNTFDDMHKSLPVIVPIEAVDVYCQADNWKEFTHIVNYLAKGQCGDDLYYELNSKGVLHIYGTGEMYDKGQFDRAETSQPWYGERDLIRSLVIDEGATTIGCHMFEGCKNLEHIVLPSTLGYIGSMAFADCTSLDNVVLPEGVVLEKNGDSSVFIGCTSLTSVTLPQGLTRIPFGLFARCVALEHIDIPATVTEIGGYAFDYCFTLKDINIPSGVTKIGEHAFATCESLIDIELPEGLREIGNSAFYGTMFREINLPSTVTKIGSYAFQRCNRLECLTVMAPTPPALDTYDPFMGLDKSRIMLHVASEAALPLYQAADVWKDFSMASYSLAEGKCGEKATYTVYSDHSIAIRGEGATYDSPQRGYDSYRSQLTQAFVGNGITALSNSDFANCPALTAVAFPSDSAHFERIGDDVFLRCASLQQMLLPKTTQSIGARAFKDCASLTLIRIPNALNSIGEDAFLDCNGLTYAEYENCNHVFDIGYANLFSNPLLYSHNCYEWGQDKPRMCKFNLTTTLKPFALAGYNYSGKLDVIELRQDAIPEGAYYGAKLYYYGGGISATMGYYPSYRFILGSGFPMPEGVKHVGDYAFYGMSFSESNQVEDGKSCLIGFPNTIKTIGKYSYANLNANVKSVVFSFHMERIGEHAFAGNDQLTEVLCTSLTPPELAENSFDERVYTDATLYVPALAEETYRTHPVWSRFSHIVAKTNYKLPKPVLRWSGNAIVFDCDVPDATIHYTVSMPSETVTPDVNPYTKVLPNITIKAKATHPLYADSDEATFTISPTAEDGDANGDGVIDVHDVEVIRDIILRGAK